MTRLLAPAVSIAAAIALAVTASIGHLPLTATIAVFVVLLALGWPVLMPMAATRWSSSVLIALSGLAALAVAWRFGQDKAPLTTMAALLAGCVVAAFVQQMLRRERSDLVETLTGTVSGQVLAVLGSGWALMPHTGAGPGVVLIAALPVIVAVIIAHVPLDPSVRGWTAFVVASVMGVIGAAVFADGGLIHNSLIAIAVAAVAAGTAMLFQSTMTKLDPWAIVAAGLGPVFAAGTVGYTVARLAGG